MALTFQSKVTKISVKERQVKMAATRETPAYYETIREADVTLRFDPDEVEMDVLVGLVGDMSVATGLATTSRGLPPELQG